VITAAAAIPPAARRLTLASAAVAVADLVIGCTVFGVATLAILAAFGAGWMGLASEYASRSLTFGSLAQYRAAEGLLLLCPVFAVEVAWLGYRAFQLPRRLWRLALETPAAPPAHAALPAWSGSNAPVPMADAALWAVRGQRAPSELRYVSLLIGTD